MGVCFHNGQYLIALKIAKIVMKLSNFKGFVRQTFIDNQQFVKQYKRKIKKLMCNNCGASMIKLHSCSGCMKLFYCSKKCQKLHWNLDHRLKCDGIWTDTRS